MASTKVNANKSFSLKGDKPQKYSKLICLHL